MKIYALMTGLCLSTQILASPMFGSIAPLNHYSIPDDDKASSGISEEEFNRINESIRFVYEPIIKEKGGTLVVTSDWKNATVNAYADRKDENWNVTMFGGLARFKGMTPDAFTCVACHEIGHHIGGAPTYQWMWASAEGQADYFSALKCTRRLWAKDDNVALMEGVSVDPTASAACEKAFSSAQEVALCKRTTVAAFALASILNRLGGEFVKLDYATPSPKVVEELLEKHPPAQCRLDTYFAGALCPVGIDEDVSFEDELLGTCNSGTSPFGFRPRCWYFKKN